MRPRALAIIEVLGVLALGWLLTRLMMQLLPVPPLELELERAIVVQRPAFFRLAILATVPLTVQAACLLMPAHLISRFLRRESFLGSAPGTKECLKGVLLVGLAAFCLFALPMKGLLAMNELNALGKGPFYWELLHKPWDLGFWVFMAVGSFVLIPILEELVYRGYCQTRLEREFGGLGAVVGTSVLFAAVHFQYYRADLLNLSMLLSLFLVSLGIGAAFFATRSLAAPMLVHSLMNIPAKNPWDIVLFGLMLLGVIFLRKRTYKLLRSSFAANQVSASDSLFLLPVALFAGGMQLFPGAAMIVFIVSLAVVIVVVKRSASEKEPGQNSYHPISRIRRSDTGVLDDME